VLLLVVELMFVGFFLVGATLVLITVGKSSLGLLTFVKGMHVLTSLPT